MVRREWFRNGNAVFIGKYYVMLPVSNTYYNLKSVDGGDNYTCGWYDDECIQVDYLDAIDGVNADLIAKTEQELLKRKFDGLYDKLDESKTEMAVYSISTIQREKI